MKKKDGKHHPQAPTHACNLHTPRRHPCWRLSPPPTHLGSRCTFFLLSLLGLHPGRCCQKALTKHLFLSVSYTQNGAAPKTTSSASLGESCGNPFKPAMSTSSLAFVRHSFPATFCVRVRLHVSGFMRGDVADGGGGRHGNIGGHGGV